MTAADDRLRLAMMKARMRTAERIAAEMRAEQVPAPPRKRRDVVPLAGRWNLACECGLVTLPGPLARHQYATGHGMLI